eukprot:CAMPEP_0182919450 /NCGR_PEP_ID=MMETSP0105_2-20130417/2735_1 /TAXON_ID=81532 ORGANISM="Acanthoeca-like sp., Strain 10tr" /NCGR_SAMPLE_ID=MMETSP0105_2 /ASSEMBLY_ACC=CAM_ASM_000205 /LENGTH=74 /DNA_ID=CAMNT_0025056641 /DNA_START=71 /DNA_END=291 /DNA_ORIENTATION=+
MDFDETPFGLAEKPGVWAAVKAAAGGMAAAVDGATAPRVWGDGASMRHGGAAVQRSALTAAGAAAADRSVAADP